MSPKARAQWSVKRAVMVALGLGLLGLVAGVVVHYIHGGFQPRRELEPETSQQAVAKPAAELIGLSYLPADTNIAFAIQPGPIVAYAERLNRNPRELLIQAGIPANVFDELTKLGLTLQQIDHIAGGTSFKDDAISVTFRLTLVLVLRKPFADEDEFLHKLRRREAAKSRYKVDVPGIPLTMLLFRVSPTIWVFGLDDKDFEAVDRGGYGIGGKQLPTGLFESIVERLPPNAAAWIATNEDRWAEKKEIRLLNEFLKKNEWMAVLAKGRSALVALSFDDPPRMRLFIKAADEKIGEQLRTYFKKLAANDDKVRQGGGGDLAFYDAPIEPVNLFATISRFLSDAANNRP
jgi:hypothetical protein